MLNTPELSDRIVREDAFLKLAIASGVDHPDCRVSRALKIDGDDLGTFRFRNGVHVNEVTECPSSHRQVSRL